MSILIDWLFRNGYASIGFEEIKEVEYTFWGKYFKEMQMVKEL